MKTKYLFVLLAVLIIIFIIASPAILSYNFFFFFDNLLTLSLGISPLIMWGVFGLFIGGTVGVIIAVKKLKLQNNLVLYPAGGLFLFIAIMLIVTVPLAFPYGGFKTPEVIRTEVVKNDVRNIDDKYKTWIVSLGTFREYSNAVKAKDAFIQKGASKAALIEGSDYNKLSNGTYIVCADKNLTKEEAFELEKNLRAIGFNDIAAQDAGKHREKNNSKHSSSNDQQSVENNSSNIILIIGEGVRFRTNPYVDDNNIIETFENGGECVIKQKGLIATINGMTDYWYNVEYNGRQGWVFGAYTSKKIK